jgi:hypothetical protein
LFSGIKLGDNSLCRCPPHFPGRRKKKQTIIIIIKSKIASLSIRRGAQEKRKQSPPLLPQSCLLPVLCIKPPPIKIEKKKARAEGAAYPKRKKQFTQPSFEIYLLPFLLLQYHHHITY